MKLETFDFHPEICKKKDLVVELEDYPCIHLNINITIGIGRYTLDVVFKGNNKFSLDLRTMFAFFKPRIPQEREELVKFALKKFIPFMEKSMEDRGISVELIEERMQDFQKLLEKFESDLVLELLGKMIKRQGIKDKLPEEYFLEVVKTFYIVEWIMES